MQRNITMTLLINCLVAVLGFKTLKYSYFVLALLRPGHMFQDVNIPHFTYCFGIKKTQRIMIELYLIKVKQNMCIYNS